MAQQGVPETMAAVLLTGHGGFDKLVYRTDVPVSVPGKEEVLIRVGADGKVAPGEVHRDEPGLAASSFRRFHWTECGS